MGSLASGQTLIAVGNNPVSRDLAVGACGKLTARQPRERGVPRLK
jgi:hypothetical protein